MITVYNTRLLFFLLVFLFGVDTTAGTGLGTGTGTGTGLGTGKGTGMATGEGPGGARTREGGPVGSGMLTGAG